MFKIIIYNYSFEAQLPHLCLMGILVSHSVHYVQHGKVLQLKLNKKQN